MKVCVLMPWGRVGSNLMMSYLRSILKGKFANEPLNQIANEDSQSVYLKDFFSDMDDDKDACLKITIRSIKDLDDVSEIIDDKGVYVIKMFRRNHIKTVISQIRAEQYALKTKNETGSAKWAVRNSEEPLGPTVIETSVLERRLKIVEGDQQKLENVKFGKYVDVYYEDIASDVFNVFQTVSEFLDRPFNDKFKIPFRKATPDDLSKIIINLEEINEWLSSQGREQILESA